MKNSKFKVQTNAGTQHSSKRGGNSERYTYTQRKREQARASVETHTHTQRKRGVNHTPTRLEDVSRT